MLSLIPNSEDLDTLLDPLMKRLNRYFHRGEKDVENLPANNICSDIQKAAELLTLYSAENQNLKQEAEQLNWQLAGVQDARERMEKIAFLNVDTAEDIYNAKEALKIAHSELESHQKQLKHLAITDALTGIYNRRYLIDFLSNIEKKPLKTLSFMMIDLDKFKEVNDTYGHDAGDAALKEFASTCSKEIPEGCILGRFGGEEFVLILPELNIREASFIAEKIRVRTESMLVECGQHRFSLTASIGLAQWLNSDISIEMLVQRADKAMYSAKRKGRNQVVEG